MAHAKPRSPRLTRTGRIRVIQSYAHRDERLRQELDKHLSPLRRSKAIEIWQDRRITPGSELDREIDQHLQTSDLVLLLVSPDFMNSSYCYEREMQAALRRQAKGAAKVIPIILRPVDWLPTPIGKLVALPRDGRPVTTWQRRDEALLDVANGVRRAVEELAAVRASSRLIRKPTGKLNRINVRRKGKHGRV